MSHNNAQKFCGTLLPLYSLPSPHGIGTLGKAAFEFADFLHDSGQSVWQLLPVEPTGYGNSPYSPLSAFAGSPLYIDLEGLCDLGLLEKDDISGFCSSGDPRYVDYDCVYSSLKPLLLRAYEKAKVDMDFVEKAKAFCSEQHEWMDDYVLFVALREHFDNTPWYEWPDEDLKMRKAEALARYRIKLQDKLCFHCFLQYLFFSQWAKLREYCNSKGVYLLGDLPIYVAMDSAEVWAHPEQFLLDKSRRPQHVAGVPPDYFSADGQLWGNPLYDWDYMKADNYSWWLSRLRRAAVLYDCVRIDHFRAFESYWSVPGTETTAKNGTWVKGPGMDFIGKLPEAVPTLKIVAEDLGAFTPGLADFMSKCGMPGMKVLQFAFGNGGDNPHLVANHPYGCVSYLGTHDNDTFNGWLSTATENELSHYKYLVHTDTGEGEFWAALRHVTEGPSALFIAQAQDFLGLGSDARTNVPGVANGNWRWRLLPNELTAELALRIKEYMQKSNRK